MINPKFLEKLVQHHSLNFYIYNDEAAALPLALRLEMTFENMTFESWGVAGNRDLAFFKAYMELIERICLSKSCPVFYKKYWWSKSVSLLDIGRSFGISLESLYPDNSNGMAIGTNVFKTKDSAKRELIERHTILSCLYLDIPPSPVEVKVDVAFDYQTKFYYWKVDNYFVVVCCVLLPNNGYLFTHACDYVVHKAVSKSYEEVVPNVIYYRKNIKEDKYINEIEINNISSFNHYWKFSRDRRAYDFLNAGSKKPVVVNGLKNIFYSRIFIPPLFNEVGFPLYCYRAISPEAQQLFFDNWSEVYINPIIQGKGKIPEFPHFIS